MSEKDNKDAYAQSLSGGENVAHSALLFARSEYPDMDVELYRALLSDTPVLQIDPEAPSSESLRAFARRLLTDPFGAKESPA